MESSRERRHYIRSVGIPTKKGMSITLGGIARPRGGAPGAPPLAGSRRGGTGSSAESSCWRTIIWNGAIDEKRRGEDGSSYELCGTRSPGRGNVSDYPDTTLYTPRT
jgi:hypothetical protein